MGTLGVWVEGRRKVGTSTDVGELGLERISW